MKKVLIITILFSFLLFNCGKNDDGPSVPGAADLIFPEENSECTEGVSINSTESIITFVWSSARNSTSYELILTNTDTGVSDGFKTTDTKLDVTLEKGETYSWSVTSLSNNESLTTKSETWYFHNAGGAESYAPFPATIVNPNSGSKFSDISSIGLFWAGSDVDNDITGYDVYLDNVNPPIAIVRTGTQEQFATITSLIPDVYYWKIITKDAEGNTSDSGVYQFQIE